MPNTRDQERCRPSDVDDSSLSWRKNPVETFSDWKIIIKAEDESENEHEIKAFHVHRAILGFGPRKSNYLAAAFRSFREGETQRSDLKLPFSQIEVFPAFLDYIYYHSTTGLSPETVFPLMALADYFDCPALLEETKHFVAKDLDLRKVDVETNKWNIRAVAENSLVYIEQALKYGQEEYLEWAIRTAINVGFIEKAVLALSPRAFVALMSHKFHEGYPVDVQSKIVCRYLMDHPELMSGDSSVLVKLTRIEIMPTVSSEVAKDLLQMAKGFKRGRCTEDPNWPRLTCLMRRCYSAMDGSEWGFRRDPVTSLASLLEADSYDDEQDLLAKLSACIDKKGGLDGITGLGEGSFPDDKSDDSAYDPNEDGESSESDTFSYDASLDESL